MHGKVIMNAESAGLNKRQFPEKEQKLRASPVNLLLHARVTTS